MTVETEVVDIVDKLAKFPIGDWEEARLEILRLRDKLAVHEATPVTYGEPSGDAPTQDVETVTYPDGTEVTGTAPLPTYSPVATVDLARVAELQDKLDDLHGQIATLTAMHEEATGSVAELQEKCVDLETQLALAKNAPEEATGNIEKHPAVTSLRSQVSSLRSELMDKTMAVAKATNELSSAQLAKTTAESEVESTNSANASLQARLDTAEKALADEKARADKLQEQLNSVPATTPFTLKNIFFKK